MKQNTSIFILLIFINCSTPNKIFSQEKVDCVENLQLKKDFFRKIKIIDSLVYRNQNKEFKKSLGFISRYSHVSFEDTANYTGLYPGSTYIKDRKGWLEWYEKNKCSNIQFKKK